MPEPTSLDLISLAQQGDDGALGALYDLHYPPMLRYFWVRVGNHQQAEDLTGEVFRRMLTALPRYRSIGLPFRSWLFKIAHNVLVDHYRKERGQMLVPLSASAQVENPGVDPAVAVTQKMTTQQAVEALAALEPFQQEVLTLRFLAGLSLKETALTLGKTEDAVKALQRRGLAILRITLTSD